jgi:hypothetical protein
VTGFCISGVEPCGSAATVLVSGTLGRTDKRTDTELFEGVWKSGSRK